MTNADPIVIAAAARTPIGGFQGERQPEDAADGAQQPAPANPSNRVLSFPSCLRIKHHRDI